MANRNPEYCCAGIGELLWDILPDTETLGGAPVNFAYHVNALGARGLPISTVGSDRRGRMACAELERNGLDTSAIARCENYPTGFVNASLDAHGIATYHFPDDVAWDHLQINGYALEIQHDLDAVCYGTLAMRSGVSREAILGYLDSLSAKTLRVFDINLRQNYYTDELLEAGLMQADIIKLNDAELQVLNNVWALPHSETAGLRLLVHKYHLKLAILTKGDQGSVVISPDDCAIHPGIPCKVLDTIGAGDSFTAMATLCFLKGMSPREINEQSSRLAAHVCSQQGAMTPPPDTLKL